MVFVDFLVCDEWVSTFFWFNQSFSLKNILQVLLIKNQVRKIISERNTLRFLISCQLRLERLEAGEKNEKSFEALPETLRQKLFQKILDFFLREIINSPREAFLCVIAQGCDAKEKISPRAAHLRRRAPWRAWCYCCGEPSRTGESSGTWWCSSRRFGWGAEARSVWKTWKTQIELIKCLNLQSQYSLSWRLM